MLNLTDQQRAEITLVYITLGLWFDESLSLWRNSGAEVVRLELGEAPVHRGGMPLEHLLRTRVGLMKTARGETLTQWLDQTAAQLTGKKYIGHRGSPNVEVCGEESNYELWISFTVAWA